MREFDRRSLMRRSLEAAVLALGVRAGKILAASNATSVIAFRRSGEPDDSGALGRALASGGPVYLPAGGGSGDDGAYLIDDVMPLAGSTLFGDGIGRTVVRPRRTPVPDQRAAFHCDSGGPHARIAGIRIKSMTLEGWVREEGFAEHQHLIHLNGVENVLIEDVEFKGFQGDGLYLGSSRNAGVERHNADVTVRRCLFDGINHDNRNAISVIDGDRILIEDCAFRNCTRGNMPGAIDMESDANPWSVIRRISIVGCQFENVGGNVATIGMHIPADVKSLPSQIVVTGNTFSGYRGTGHEIYLNTGRRLTERDPDMAIQISGNRGTGGQGVYSLYAVKGARISGNAWQDYRAGSHVGYTEDFQGARDVAIRDTLVRCGSTSGVGIYIFTASGLVLDGTQLIDCGNGGIHSYAVCFSLGKSADISMQNMKIVSPTGRTRIAVIRDQGHKLSPLSNQECCNDFGGLPATDITSAS